jgi:AcrR family transcriptional regulator
MSPRVGLSTQAVVTAALELIDQHGADALSLTRLAERSGVATPSLYKHVAGLPGLKSRISVRILGEMTDALLAVTGGLTGDRAVRATCTAYRAYFLAHPHRLPYLEPAPDPGDTALHDAAGRLVEVLFGVLSAYGLSGSAAVHATRCLRAAVHGFVALEIAGGFGLPEDVDRTFDLLTNMIIDGLPSMAAASTTA